MRILEGVAAVILVALLALILIYARREVISRGGGTIDMNIRLSTFVPERGWAPGVGRFSADELRWYRVFSLGVRPKRVLSRSGLVVEGRRPPAGAERLTLPDGWVVVRCRNTKATVEVALAESALTGLLSWLEAAPASPPSAA
jgi:uncharacterized protein DUF2550